MTIWFKPYTLRDVQPLMLKTLAEHLSIELTEIGPDFLTATMPVDDRTRQPYGVLHGGASAALAETLGSVGSNLCVDPGKNMCVGQEINASHVRPVSNGIVLGIAKPVHLGTRSHIWEIRITDSKDKLVCISQLTMFVLDRPAQQQFTP
jgi:1,4-dihydroxy-2-naphthoyl-CoA hydrolase